MARVINRVREMTPQDIESVMVIEEATFPAPWSRRMLTDELAAPGRYYIVLDGPDGIEGYGGAMVSDQEGHVMTMAVGSDRRGRGLGTTLLSALLSAALGMGASRLLLEVRPSNMAARHLYQKFGFVPVGVRPRYYRDEDALVMWVDDADTPEYAARLAELSR